MWSAQVVNLVQPNDKNYGFPNIAYKTNNVGRSIIKLRVLPSTNAPTRYFVRLVVN